MHDVLKSDIFFVVTTIAIVLVTIALLIALAYVIRILRDANKVSEVLRDEGEEIVKDIGEMRKGIKKQGLDVFGFIREFFTLFTSNRKKRK